MRALTRRGLVFLTLLGLLGGLAPVPSVLAASPTDTTVAGIDVDAATIPDLQGAMDDGDLSAVQLTRFYLKRIQQLNGRLNAVITVNANALAEAAAADAARAAGDTRPLLGIPILVKDNVNTTGMPTTAGSFALWGSTPEDAFIIERLKAAGAIVLGKANLSEWANFRSGPSSSGWSGIGEQTNMAHVLDRNPCGSSSGSGVAAAASLAVAAIGTETDGSIVCPSGANGIVGIKPTLGLWSRAGVIPISADQDTAGPMTRNVTDAAVLLGAMTGIDPDDPATAGQAGNAFADYTQFLDADALAGARIGVWREGTYDPAAVPEVTPILEATIDALEAAGATVIDNVNILPNTPETGAIFGAEFAALLCEFKTDIATYLHTYTGAGYPKTLADLIAFNEANAQPSREGPWNNLIFELAEATDGRGSPDCDAARAAATPPVQAAIDALLAAHDLDAIIGLTNGPAWETDSKLGDLSGNFSTFVGSSSAAAISGYADITVPAGFIGPLPVGITFIGGAWDEPELIALAYAFEQATQVRTPPEFLPTLSAMPSSGHRGGGTNQTDYGLPAR